LLENAFLLHFLQVKIETDLNNVHQLYRNPLYFSIVSKEELLKKKNIRQEEFEDTKGVIRIRISKKNRKHNGQKKSTKVQTTIYKTYTKTKARVTGTPLKTGGELRCSGRLNSSCSTNWMYEIIHVFILKNPLYYPPVIA